MIEMGVYSEDWIVWCVDQWWIETPAKVLIITE